jgi:PIN domain nuclease of toxin-antitoxin system
VIIVLDSSALLAALLGEPGADRVDEVIDGAVMTTVNLAEVIGHFARAGADRTRIASIVAGLPIKYVVTNRDLAMDIGLMRPRGEPFGLSLGDRICLAHAKQVGGVALTADRTWAAAATALGVEVELIR